GGEGSYAGMPTIVVPIARQAAFQITNLMAPLVRLHDLERMRTRREQVAKNRVGGKCNRRHQRFQTDGRRGSQGLRYWLRSGKGPLRAGRTKDRPVLHITWVHLLDVSSRLYGKHH